MHMQGEPRTMQAHPRYGNVVADLLFGKADPSGKLPMTFPKTENEVPAHTPERYPGVNGTVEKK